MNFNPRLSSQTLLKRPPKSCFHRDIMLESGKIPHALLFTGPRGAKLDEAARQFALDLIGKHPHPDIHEYFPEGKTGMHPISALRELTNQVGFVPYQAKWKLFIVHEAERMLPTSANALLKTFEEPTEQTVIVLLSHHPEKMLSTILSRCQKINYPADQSRPEHPILKSLAGQAPLPDETDDSDGLFETILLWYRDRMLLDIEGGEPYLTYPEHRKEVERAARVPLERVEKVIGQARLGLERSIKFSTCLEALFSRL